MFTNEGDTFCSAVRASTPTDIDDENDKRGSPPLQQHSPVYFLATYVSQFHLIHQVKVKLPNQLLTTKMINIANLQQPRLPQSTPFSQLQQLQQPRILMTHLGNVGLTHLESTTADSHPVASSAGTSPRGRHSSAAPRSSEVQSHWCSFRLV